jgi:tetratricopeptide (TPR) repeat protein
MIEKIKKILKNKKIVVGLLFVFLAVAVQFPIRKLIAQKIANHAGYYFNGGGYNLEKAGNLYKTALKIDQKNWLAHYQLARIYFVESDFGNGLKEIKQALAVNPENKRSFYIKGLLDGYAYNHTEAEKDFQNFIAWAPNEWPGYMDLSWVYINSGKYDEAVTTVDNALVLFPNNAWLYANKGLAEYKLGKYEEAETSLGIARKLAKKLTPEDWAQAYPGNNSKDAEKGVEEIKTAIEYNLKLANEATGSEKDIADLKISMADLASLSKYAGKQNIYDGVTLSACGSSSENACSGASCASKSCEACDSAADIDNQYQCTAYDPASCVDTMFGRMCFVCISWQQVYACCSGSTCSSDADCAPPLPSCSVYSGSHK